MRQGRSHLLCHSLTFHMLHHHWRSKRKSSTPSTTQSSLRISSTLTPISCTKPVATSFSALTGTTKLHPETAVSRANLLAFTRHALANGMPIRLRELSHGTFSSYIATKIAGGESFYGTKGRQKMRLHVLASAFCYLYSSADEDMPDEMRADVQMTVKSIY